VTCKHNIPAQLLEGARSVSAQGCCPPEDTTPPDEEIVNPGEEINPGGDLPGDEDPPIPQPDPQPDPPARIYRKRAVARRNLAQRFPTPSNRWRWVSSSIDGTPPTSSGPIAAGGTFDPGPPITIEER
jgi:hypothetical protein